jgi:hypothetical protein
MNDWDEVGEEVEGEWRGIVYSPVIFGVFLASFVVYFCVFGVKNELYRLICMTCGIKILKW